MLCCFSKGFSLRKVSLRKGQPGELVCHVFVFPKPLSLSVLHCELVDVVRACREEKKGKGGLVVVVVVCVACRGAYVNVGLSSVCVVCVHRTIDGSPREHQSPHLYQGEEWGVKAYRMENIRQSPWFGCGWGRGLLHGILYKLLDWTFWDNVARKCMCVCGKHQQAIE